MKTICLYFEIHQIIHLKRYRCFDIGTDHYYYDDYENERSITEIAERSYIPALTTLLEMVKNNGGAFKVAFSISGVALEQLEIYSPAVIDLLHQLNDTGCCEFLCEPYSHGLSSLANEECFREEVSQTSALSASCKSSLLIAASVMTNPNIVHIFGCIIPEPLHIPPTVTVFPPASKVTATSFEIVSVVMIAHAA